MSITMKKLQFLALTLACVLLFSSCEGIGDGALVNGVVGAPIIQADHVETETAGAVAETVETPRHETLTRPSSIAMLGKLDNCIIVSFKSGKVVSQVDLKGSDADAAYSLFSKSTLESAGNNNGINRNNCIKVSFLDSDGEYETYYVGQNDVFHKDNSSTPTYFGKISGLHNLLKGYFE